VVIVKDVVDASHDMIERVRKIKQELLLSDDSMGQWHGYFDKQ
jgi:hypothetical protein